MGPNVKKNPENYEKWLFWINFPGCRMKKGGGWGVEDPLAPLLATHCAGWEKSGSLNSTIISGGVIRKEGVSERKMKEVFKKRLWTQPLTLSYRDLRDDSLAIKEPPTCASVSSLRGRFHPSPAECPMTVLNRCVYLVFQDEAEVLLMGGSDEPEGGEGA